MLLEPFNSQLTIDPKGRLTLPVAVRGALGMQGINKLVAVANQGDRGGIALFTLEEYRDAIAARTKNADPFDPRTQAFLRAVVATNQTVSIDSVGRVLVPPQLRGLVGIDRDVVMFSMAGWLEVWDRARWEETVWPDAVNAWETESAAVRAGGGSDDGGRPAATKTGEAG